MAKRIPLNPLSKPTASVNLSAEDDLLLGDALLLAIDALQEQAAILAMRNPRAVGPDALRGIASRMSALHTRITS